MQLELLCRRCSNQTHLLSTMATNPAVLASAKILYERIWVPNWTNLYTIFFKLRDERGVRQLVVRVTYKYLRRIITPVNLAYKVVKSHQI